MPERFSAKTSRPVFEVGIARRVLVRIGHRDLILRIEIVVELRVDLLAPVAADSRSLRSNGEDVFAAAVFLARPFETSRVQAISHFIVIRHRHLAQELRDESR